MEILSTAPKKSKLLKSLPCSPCLFASAVTTRRDSVIQHYYCIDCRKATDIVLPELQSVTYGNFPFYI